MTPRFTVNLKELEGLTEKMEEAVALGVTEGSVVMTSHIISRHLTGGTTNDRVGVRSSRMRSSTRPMKTKIENGSVSGGTEVGVKYASTHIGPKGKRTTIRPVRSKFLTIPLPPALTGAGRMKYNSARNYPNLRFIKSKAGNLLLAQINNGGITPFFVLKDRVDIMTRIHPEVVEQEVAPMLTRVIEKHLGRIQ